MTAASERQHALLLKLAGFAASAACTEREGTTKHSMMEDTAHALLVAQRHLQALEIIAGRRQPADNLMSNIQVAIAALDWSPTA
jgi:hypothetical protein